MAGTKKGRDEEEPGRITAGTNNDRDEEEPGGGWQVAGIEL